MTTSPELQWATNACTLPTAERPLREAQFDDLFASSLLAVRRLDETTAVLLLDPEAEERARELAARESSCCSFFGFDFATTGGGLAMRVTVPAAYAGVLAAFAAHAAAAGGRPSSSDR